MANLTERLSFLMNQVAQNQIEEIISKDKLQKQQLMEKEERAKMLCYKTTESLYHHQSMKQHRNSNLRNLIPSRKKKDEPEEDEENKVKKITTLSSIWGAKKTFEKYPSEKGGSTKPQKVEPATSKFQKAAKFTVLINSMKQGRDVCTCESLDAKCKIHDS